MVQNREEQVKNTKGKESPENQSSSRRIFCHNSLYVELIFTNVLPHDSHQAADTLIYTLGSALKVPFCSQSLYLTPVQSFNHFFHLK